MRDLRDELHVVIEAVGYSAESILIERILQILRVEWHPIDSAPMRRKVDLWAGDRRWIDCVFYPDGDPSGWRGWWGYGGGGCEKVTPRPICWRYPPDPAEPTIPEDMKRWDGLEVGPPKDWNNAWKVLYRGGFLGMLNVDSETHWVHHGDEMDIVAYTPKGIEK